jgi:hypothetical protein
MYLYLAKNGAVPTTAAAVPVTTGSVIKTLLQLKPLTGVDLKIKGWGISFDGSVAATPGKVELIETDVAATVTAFAAADITKLTNPAGPAADSAAISLGTAASGFTASAEGTITAIRELDTPRLIAPTNQFDWMFPLGQEPVIQAGKFARVRVTFAAAINAYCYIIFET